MVHQLDLTPARAAGARSGREKVVVSAELGATCASK
jgi:hypothetical protein